MRRVLLSLVLAAFGVALLATGPTTPSEAAPPAEVFRRAAQAEMLPAGIVERCRTLLANAAMPAGMTAAEVCRRVAQADATPVHLVERCCAWLNSTTAPSGATAPNSAAVWPRRKRPRATSWSAVERG